MKFMDLVFHRYASPFLLLDQIIDTDGLSEFVSMVWDVTVEEQQWQYFLAKVFDKSFEDFKETVKPQKPISPKELETTINESFNMMNSFIPE